MIEAKWRNALRSLRPTVLHCVTVICVIPNSPIDQHIDLAALPDILETLEIASHQFQHNSQRHRLKNGGTIMRAAIAASSATVMILLAVTASSLPAFAQRSREQCLRMADAAALHGGTPGALNERRRYMNRCMRGNNNPHGRKGMGGGGGGMGMGGGGR